MRPRRRASCLSRDAAPPRHILLSLGGPPRLAAPCLRAPLGRATPPAPAHIGVVGPSSFIRSFILKGGFRDGLVGFSIAAFTAHHAFLKYLMLWELQNRKEK